MKKNTVLIIIVLIVIFILYKNNQSSSASTSPLHGTLVAPTGDVVPIPATATSIPTQTEYTAMKNAGLPDNIIFNRF